MPADAPQFPVILTWHETGEVDEYKDERDLLCNLESFDSACDGHEAAATDARQRPVLLLVDIVSNTVEVELAEPVPGMGPTALGTYVEFGFSHGDEPAEPDPWWVRLVGLFIPRVNKNLDEVQHRISTWRIAFSGDGQVAREVALDRNGDPVFAAPTNSNYGFWGDVGMSIEDFRESFEVKTITAPSFDNVFRRYQDPGKNG